LISTPQTTSAATSILLQYSFRSQKIASNLTYKCAKSQKLPFAALEDLAKLANVVQSEVLNSKLTINSMVAQWSTCERG
jgi:hypothetical protein